MKTFFDFRKCKLMIVILVVCLPHVAQAQTPNAKPKQRPAPSAARAAVPEIVAGCDLDSALALVESQASEAKTIDDVVERIAVTIAAADVLWMQRQETARALFAEAFSLATEDYKAKGDKEELTGIGLVSQTPDQRFVVMRHIAKHDPAWARRLAVRAADDTREAAEEAKATAAREADSSREVRRRGEKLAQLASSMLDVDQATAVSVVRRSFRYPASIYQIFFLFSLAERNQAAADGLSLEAIKTYANSTEDIVHFSPYVFARNHAIGETRSSAYFRPPAGFKVNANMPHSFTEVLLQRAAVLTQNPAAATSDIHVYTEPAQMIVALDSLTSLRPETAVRTTEAITALRVTLTAEAEKQASGALRWRDEQAQPSTFDSYAERYEREPNANRKDLLITNAILAAKTPEEHARVEELAANMKDADVRRQVLSWWHFNQAQAAIKERRFEDAAKLIAKVDEPEHRAYLQLESATEVLKESDDKQQARELLDAVAASAQRAPNSNERARTQLGVVHLYTKFDPLRAMEVMGDAMKTINALDKPNFSNTYVGRKIESRWFSMYSGYQMQGFSLANTFRDLAQKDFYGALAVAQGLKSKSQRLTATLSLAEQCVEQASKGKRKSVPTSLPAKRTKPKP